MSIKKKNKIYNEFCQANDPERKKSLQETLKKIQNNYSKSHKNKQGEILQKLISEK